MQNYLRNYRKIGLFLALSWTLSAAAFAVSQKELRIGVAQEYSTLNPLIQSSVAASYILDMSVRSLLTLDPQGKWVPLLIQEIPTLENGLASFYEEDGIKKIKADFELLPNTHWGDGTPLTHRDVKFTWQVGRNENVPVGSRDAWTEIERVELDPQNDRKFTFYFKEARWDYNRLPQFYVLPQHLEGPILADQANLPGGYEKNTLYVTDPTNPGLYQGPYRIAEVKLGSHVSLVPNEYFYGKKPYFQKIIISIIPNTAALEANLLSGTIDMISSLGLSFNQAVSLEKRIKEKNLPYVVYFEQSLLYEHIDLQLRNPFLQDLRVRKALVHAIDREALSQAIFDGKQPKAIHNIAKIDAWYTEDPEQIVFYPHSKRKARKLLEEAGWKLGEDGFRYKDGQKLTFQLMTTAGNKNREIVQAYLQEEWKKVGVEITIKNEPARVFFGTTVTQSKFPAMALFAWFSSPESTPRSTLHSESIATEENNYTGQNYTGWRNPEVDGLIEEIDVTFDAAKRKELVGKILYHYTNEVPVIPLYYRAQSTVLPKNMVGLQLVGHQFGEGNHVEYWHLKE